MNGTDIIIVINAGLLAGTLTYATNWFALKPWRRSKAQGQHWTEQARVVFPVITAARSNLWTIPGILTLAVLLYAPDPSPLWFFTGLAAATGAYAGTLPLDHEVFPRLFVTGWLRNTIIGILLRFLIWIIFIGAAIWMPYEFNWTAVAISAGVLLLWLVSALGGSPWLSRKLGLYAPAPERLQKIAAETSARMDIPFREVFLIRSQQAQAFAFPRDRKLAFTERLLAIAPDDEIAAICAHELAHLTEPKAVYYARYIQIFVLWPWIYFNPITHIFSVFGFYGLILITIMVPRIYKSLSHKLEVRADSMAKAHETDPGTYARALTRIYEDSLIPAVIDQKRRTHPDLYDRLLAAGITPEYPRPIPALRMAGYGFLFSYAMGGLFGFFAIHIIFSQNLFK